MSFTHREGAAMNIQIVMDHTGDTRHTFDSSDAAAVARAELRFQELTGRGFRPVAPGKNGSPGRLLQAFDNTVEETLFIPQLQGG